MSSDDRVGTEEDTRVLLLAKKFLVEEHPSESPSHSSDQSPKQRRSRRLSEDMRALRQIVRGFSVLEKLGDNNVLAALNYVEDRFGKSVRAPQRWWQR